MIGQRTCDPGDGGVWKHRWTCSPDCGRIGFDEISYKKRHKYLTIVVDIPAFVGLRRAIVRHWDAIIAAAEHNLSNGLIGSTNTKIRLITRPAFGFKSPDALIALAMLSLGGHRPQLPGRQLA